MTAIPTYTFGRLTAPSFVCAGGVTGTIRAADGPERSLVPSFIRRAASIGHVTPKALTGPARHKVIVRVRWAAMLALREVRGMSYPQIGRYFGDRDHTTVMHGCEQAKRLLATDPDFARLYIDIEAAA